MRLFRRFLLCLALAIALAAIFVAAAFIPAVQTMIAQHVLDQHPNLRASLGSLAAGRGDLEAHDLSLEIGGAILTLPALQAQLPVTTALWDRKVQIRTLVAKGWTLDLSGQGTTPAPTRSTAAPVATPGAPAPPIPAFKAAIVFHQILSGLQLPPDVTFEEVDLEGDILIADGPRADPTSVHVIIKGGPVGAGREGTFTIDATIPLAASGRTTAVLTAHGRLVVATDSARTINRVELTIDLSAKGRALPAGLSLSLALAAANGTRDETYTLGLSREGRHAVNLVARFPASTGQLAGTWQVDLRDADVAPFFPQRALPALATTGDGDFETDAALTRVHATGRLNTVASRLGQLAPSLERLGTIALNADFDATHQGQSLHFDRLNASVNPTRPVAIVHSLQPFNIDEKTGDLQISDAHSDWLEGSLQGFPLAWLVGSPGGFAIGGDATGEFIARASNDGITVQSKTTVTVPGLTLQKGSSPLVHDLDLSFPLLAEFGHESWKVKCTPAVITSAGQRLASVDTTVSRGSVAQQIKITATWNADLNALATQQALPALRRLPGRSASGEFSIVSDSWTNLESKLVITGHDATHTLTASLHVNADPSGRLTFLAPIKIKLGPSGSEFSADGNWALPSARRPVTISLTGDSVALNHLLLVAAPLSAAGRLNLPANPVSLAGGSPAPTSARDQAPFWDGPIGRVSFDFGHMTAWGHNFADVGGTFFLDHGSIKLEGGRGVFHQDRHLRAEGTVAFDAAADFPYSVNATATVDEIDAALLLGPPPRGQEPMLHGRFSVAGILTGRGVNAADLAGGTQEEFRLTSVNGGSTRLLQASVANSLTETATPVKDALGTVGSVFGKLLNTKANVLQSQKNPISKNTEAVLNFTYMTAEFRYDQLSLTARRESDGAIRLVDVAMTAASERLTGTGEIAFDPTKPLGARPLTLELQLGFRGHAAEYLTVANLLSAQKDDQGYAPLKQPIRFGGTLEQIDPSEWHDLLVKAAAPQKPAAEKKSN